MSEAKLEQLKKESTGHSLIKAARMYNEVMIAEFRKIFDLPSLQLYHLNLFAYIELEGSTINQISEKAGISKQAVSRTVSELITMGLLIQKPNPSDARSKLVSFQQDGPYTLEKGLQFLRNQDSLIEEILGKLHIENFSANLQKIIEAMNQRKKSYLE